MSFILDALKKLDHKRQRGSIPDLMTVHEPMPRELQRRSLWLYLFSGALLLNASLMLLWLYPWQSNKPDIKARLNAGAKQEKTSRRVEPTTAKSSQKPLDVRIMVSDTPVDKNINSESNSSERNTLKQPDSDVTKQARLGGQTNLDINVNQLKQNLKKEAEAHNKVLQDRETAALSSQQDLKTQPVTGGAQEEKIPYLGELPVSVQQELPKLTISAHIYSNNSASRMVNINGRTVREGQDAADGVRLEEITSGGAILSYKDYRFRIRL
jgi:general secretion pathway protein B